MPISVYIDNNVWDFLFKSKIDLSVALPSEEFCICITREAEFEIPPIQNTKPELKEFIETTIKKCNILTDSFFGFYEETFSQSEQRVGGLDIGRFASREEIVFMDQQRTPLKLRHQKKNSKTKLYKDEADISLAARSFHSVVLSFDDKNGPINDAYKQGGKVIFLTNFEQSNLSLSDFIKKNL
jgi:hypothetical protein